MDRPIEANYDTMKKLLWQKYLTREYSFLYISYAIDCYKIMEKTVGTTITFDLSHGEGKLVSLYGLKEDILDSYKMIEGIGKNDPQEIIRKMDRFDELIKSNYALFADIKKTDDKKVLRELLKKLDKLFLETICYYLFFVFLGYAGDLPNIDKFLKKYGKRFRKIRLFTIDADMDTEFPKLFSRFDKRLSNIAAYMWREELLDYIDGKPVNLKKIKNRQKSYLVITKAGRTVEYSLQAINSTLAKELAHIQTGTDTKQLKGRIAFKGKVTGMVAVILTANDYKKIRNGSILVTSMTKPSIVPYLTHVKGIVTDDGGALSHASIIAREMNIPCIVGTGNATTVLHDGDFVVVDADHGLVNVLNKQ